MNAAHGARDRDREVAAAFVSRATGDRGALVVAPAGLPAAVRLLEAPAEEPLRYLAPPLLPYAEPTLWVGEGGVMKSSMMTAVATAVAGGGRVFGRFAVERPRAVLIVSGEDPLRVLTNRCEACARGAGLSRERVLGNIHAIALEGTDLASPLWRLHLVREVERLDVGLVVLDPLADLASGDENDNSARREVVATWRALAATGAAVVLVAHVGKPVQDRAKRDRIRGASAIPHASRMTYFLEPGPEGVGIENVKNSRAEKLATFVVKPIIQVDDDNPSTWTVARFEYMSAGYAALTAAETFLLGQLEGGVRLTTTELKTAAKGTGVSGADIARALRGLEARGLIDFVAGERGAKHWGLVTLPGKVGKVENDLARQGDCLPDNAITVPSTLPAPYKGAGWQGEGADVGQGDDVYLADERAALREGL